MFREAKTLANCSLKQRPDRWLGDSCPGVFHACFRNHKMLRCVSLRADDSKRGDAVLFKIHDSQVHPVHFGIIEGNGICLVFTLELKVTVFFRLDPDPGRGIIGCSEQHDATRTGHYLYLAAHQAFGKKLACQVQNLAVIFTGKLVELELPDFRYAYRHPGFCFGYVRPVECLVFFLL